MTASSPAIASAAHLSIMEPAGSRHFAETSNIPLARPAGISAATQPANEVSEKVRSISTQQTLAPSVHGQAGGKPSKPATLKNRHQSSKQPGKKKNLKSKHKRSKRTQPAEKPATSHSQKSAAKTTIRFSGIHGSSPSVLVVGDSLAVGVGMTLAGAFEKYGKVYVREMGKVSSGLDSPAFYDWNHTLSNVLDHERYDLIVLMLGANDAHNSPGTRAWRLAYESKFAEFLKIPAQRRIRTIVVGLPPMKKPDFSDRVRAANEAIRNASRLYPEACLYFDAYNRFSDQNGNYTDQVSVNGEWNKVRAGDGVHFTGKGYSLLSKLVADEFLKLSVGRAAFSHDSKVLSPHKP